MRAITGATRPAQADFGAVLGLPAAGGHPVRIVVWARTGPYTF